MSRCKQFCLHIPWHLFFNSSIRESILEEDSCENYDENTMIESNNEIDIKDNTARKTSIDLDCSSFFEVNTDKSGKGVSKY